MRSERLAIIAIAAIVVLAGLFLLGTVLIGAWFDRRNDSDDLGRLVRRPADGLYATAERGRAPAGVSLPRSAPIPARIS
jgi:hypothetical protein